MADQPQRQMTKAEAGRLGGLRTKAKHGTEHYRRAGQLGAKTVLERFGPDHMAEIGRKGFRALAGRIGCHRSRKAAVAMLQAMGRIRTPAPIPPLDPNAPPFEDPDEGPDDDGGPQP